jgi:hypothetical protein
MEMIQNGKMYSGYGTLLTSAIGSKFIYSTTINHIQAASYNALKPLHLEEQLRKAIADGSGYMLSNLLSQCVSVPLEYVSFRLVYL